MADISRRFVLAFRREIFRKAEDIQGKKCSFWCGGCKALRLRQAFCLLLTIVFLAWPALALASETYQLGPGDVLQVSVWGHEELNRTVKVRPDGKISFPFVGDLVVDKLTPEEVRERLTTQLAEYILNPQVTVAVQEFRTIGVQVSGKVKSPGLYRLQPGSSASDAIALAGGFAVDADVSRVKVSSRSGQSVLIAVTDQGFQPDIVLADGDQITVPQLDRVTVLGAVRSPGVVMIQPPGRVADAIAAAGGLTQDADLTRVKLIPRVGEPQVVDLSGYYRTGAQSSNLPVRDGDQIILPEQQKATVLGEVNKPGLVPVVSGDNLLDLLAKAGGTTNDANLARVEILTYIDNALVATETVDATDQFAKLEVAVPENGRLVISVPKLKRQVTVLGEVARPGTYPITEQTRLLEAIGAAGGPTERASLAEVRVYRGGEFTDPQAVVLGRDHLLFEGDVEENIPVHSSDVIFVPETKRINWDKVIMFLTGLKLVKDLLN